MRKFTCLSVGWVICVTVGLMGVQRVAFATPIASDDFTYADGALAGNNGGSGWGGAWTDGGTVAGGSAATAGSDAFRTLATSITPTAGTSVYTSFFLGADSTSANDFAGLSFFSGGAERLFFGMTFDTNSYGINVTGKANTDSGVATTTAPRFLIGEVLFSGVSSFTTNLYLDTAANLVSSYTGNFEGVGAAWDQIRIASGGSTGTTATYDEIRIGTTLSDVTVPVPVPATLALLGLGLAGIGWSRRRKQLNKI